MGARDRPILPGMLTLDLSFVHRLLDRATVRAFDARRIPADLLDLLLQAALNAPSELNLQPWRPIVCTSDASRARLRDCCLGQPQVESAPVSVIVTADSRVFIDDLPRAADEMIACGKWAEAEREARLTAMRGNYEDPLRLRTSAVRNATIFGHQLLLAAYSAGLSAFWLAGLDEDALRAAFHIPDVVVVAGVVGLGWPASSAAPARMPKLLPERLLRWEAY